jgi:uncharacterized UPF0146 family protein
MTQTGSRAERATKVRVGLIGLGRMGAAIAHRLQEQEVKVTAFDMDHRKCRAIRSKHVQTVKTPALVAEASDVVISIVTDDHAVRSVFSEMLQGQVAKKLFIEMSTIEPATIRYLAPLVEQRGAALIDSPVLGSVAAARDPGASDAKGLSRRRKRQRKRRETCGQSHHGGLSAIFGGSVGDHATPRRELGHDIERAAGSPDRQRLA